jgi:transposase-like protein
MLQINLYRTACTMAHKIRKAMADRDAHYTLAGLIEMDDAYLGQRQVPGKRGRGAEKKVKIIVSVKVNQWERPVYAQMTVIPSLDKDNISKMAEEKIAQDSTVKIDSWPSYHVLEDHTLHHEKVVLKNPADASKVLP